MIAWVWRRGLGATPCQAVQNRSSVNWWRFASPAGGWRLEDALQYSFIERAHRMIRHAHVTSLLGYWILACRDLTDREQTC